MRNLKKCVWLSMGILSCGVLLSGCGKSKGNGVNSAVIPGANMVFSCDMKAMQQSAMYTRLKALSEEQADAAETGPVEDIEKMRTSAKATMGITDEDVKTIVVSAKFIGKDLDKMEEGLSKNAEIAFGIQLDKAVTLDQLEAFIKASSKEEKATVTLKRETVSGVKMLTVEGDTEGDELYLACISDGMVILGGTKTGVENAFTRMAKPVPVAQALKDSGIPADLSPQCFFALTLSEAMKTKLDETAGMFSADPGPRGQILKCLEGMTGATFTVNMADDMGLGLFMNLASVEKAAQLKNLFDNVVVSGIKMGASMMTGGKPLPMLEAISSQANATTASVKITITGKDIDTIQAIAEEKKAARNAPPIPPKTGSATEPVE